MYRSTCNVGICLEVPVHEPNRWAAYLNNALPEDRAADLDLRTTLNHGASEKWPKGRIDILLSPTRPTNL